MTPTMHLTVWAGDFARDVRHGFRMIGRMPGVAAVVILSLAVGIGVNTAIFSWIETLVLKPLPGVVDASSFHSVEARTEAGTYPGSSWLEYRDLREQLTAFRDVISFRMVPFYVGEPGRTERSYGLLVSGNYFAALGLRPAAGRFIDANDPRAEAVVISYDYWQTRFGGAPDIVGRVLRVNGQSLTIAGVAPRDFQGTILGLTFDLWASSDLAPLLLNGSRELDDRSFRGSSVIGRLRSGVTDRQAQINVDDVMRQLARVHPDTNATIQGEVLAFWKSPRGPQRFLVGALTALQSLTILLLLAVCGNTANLMLARAGTRQREVSVRLAIGAGRWRVARLLLMENLVLASLGATLGAIVAVWATQALRAVPFPAALPIKFQTGIDGTGLAFNMLLGLICGVAFGTAPAFQLARINPQITLRAGPATPTRSGLRDSLMGIEVALAIVVLVVAGLFLKTFRNTHDTDTGFRRDGVLLAAYDLSGRNVDGPGAREFAATLLDRLRALPGVGAAAISTSVPLDLHGLPTRSFTVEGHARADRALDQALTNSVTPDYFRTLEIPFVRGKDFTDLHDRATAPQVIVNEEFQNRYLGSGEPIGRRLESGGVTYTVAGVVRTTVYEAFGETPAPAMYFSYRERPARQGEVHLLTRAGVETIVVPDLRRVLRDLDPLLPLYNVRTMNEHIETNLVFQRIPARMFVVLGPLLLVLAAIGIYSVVSYTVSHRTNEIGIRLALGATGPRVVGQLMSEALRVIVFGALMGWLVAFVTSLHISGGKLDRVVFAGVPAVLLLVAATACWLPARRATKIDPVRSLRQE